MIGCRRERDSERKEIDSDIVGKRERECNALENGFFKVLSSEHRTYPKNVSRKAATGSVLEIKLKSIINRARK